MSYKKEKTEKIPWKFPLQFVSTTHRLDIDWIHCLLIIKNCCIIYIYIFRKEVERCILVWGIKNDSLYEKKSTENREFCTNYISTHQYTIVTFVPKNIWQQFHRLSNVYFFFLSILQTIRQV
jgi:hypothetical protein